ncbi:hypothetical protein DFJ73DRAFT_786981 [Zopfochytrium polystomum]|nr:hypothetical protein DFJ73DRAFT_786981 [Zopfochytrium polystomum]
MGAARRDTPPPPLPLPSPAAAAAAAALGVTRHRRHRSRRPTPAASTRFVLPLLTHLPLLLLLAAGLLLLAGLFAQPAAYTAWAYPQPGNTISSRPSSVPGPGDRVEAVGDAVVMVGSKVGSGSKGGVYRASVDGTSYGAVLKVTKNGEAFKDKEIDATRKAGQLISVEGSRMVQHKVGDEGLTEYLKGAKRDPTARAKFQQVREAGGKKPKLSENLYKQVRLQQYRVGYYHGDVNAENIRITEKKQEKGKPYRAGKADLIDWGAATTPTELPSRWYSTLNAAAKGAIQSECEKHGFAFRAVGVGLERRAPGAAGGGACARSGKADKGGGGGARATTAKETSMRGKTGGKRAK